MADQKQSAERLFGAALELPPESRSAFLDQACRETPEIRRIVEDLLREDARLGSFLDGPVFEVDTARLPALFPPYVSAGPPPLPPAAVPDTLPRFRPGDVIANRFEVVRFIARGGMGEVYEVKDRFLQGVNVALKIIRPEIAADAGSAHRFEQEVILARKVTHLNLCPIYDISRCEQPEPAFFFLTMKLLRGETLDARIKQPNRLATSEAVEICRQLLRGVAALHHAGIVHRDIKPNNIMLEQTPEGLPESIKVSLMDFGLARLHQTESMTAYSVTIAGTLGYMAPELLRGQPPSKATDLYALGIVMHQVLTGERPAESPTDLSLVPSPALRSVAAPANLLQAIESFLSVHPERRARAFEQLQAESLSTSAIIPTGLAPGHRKAIWYAAAATIALLILLAAVWVTAPPAPHVLNSQQVTFSPEPKDWPLRTDGSRLYFQSADRASEMAVSGGTIVPVPALESGMQIRDVSADGAKVMAWKPEPGNEAGGGSLWQASSLGGTARKIGPYIAQDARWSPDGHTIFYADNHTIYVTDAYGTNRKKIWEAPDFVNEVIVSPDGRELSVTLQTRHNARIWRLNADGTDARPLLLDWPEQSSQWAGQWTSDGNHFVFGSNQGNQSNVYELLLPRWFEVWKKPSAVLLTGSQITIRAVTAARGGVGLFVLGEMDQGAMQVFDSKTGTRVPFTDSSSMLSFIISPDRQWMAYNEYPSGNLWKSRLDGSEPLQLTTTPAYMQEWSPDSKTLVYSDWYKLYLVSADGGIPEKLIADEQSKWEVAPTWSPDGKSIAFNYFDQQDEPTEGIHVVDISTRQLSMMPGSKGFYVASWSPDGKYLVALAQKPARMMLYTAATKAWTKLKDFDIPWGFWIWSHDSKSIYMEVVQAKSGIYMLTVPDGKWEKVAGLNGVITRQEDAYPSLTADGQIAVMSHTGVAQLYSLTWSH